MKRPLGTSATRMECAPFVLIDVETDEGVTGRAHVFCYMDLAAPLMRQVLQVAEELIAGQPVVPHHIEKLCRCRFTLLGTQGVVGMALSALDVACWDALSRAASLPLARYLGGTTGAVPAYNSNGLSLTDPDTLADEALSLLGEDFKAVKIRLGRPDSGDDLRAVRTVRSGIPFETIVMADYNQALSVEAAIERGRKLDDEGLYWIEEPIAHDDFTGCAAVTAALKTPVQIGENFCGPHVLDTAMALKSSNYVMPDLMRIGGVSGWVRAADRANLAGLPMSSHLYPEVSAHLLAATPTAHWLEYVDWAEPVLAAKIVIKDGNALIPETAGTGVEWHEDAVRHYAVD